MWIMETDQVPFRQFLQLLDMDAAQMTTTKYTDPHGLGHRVR